MQHKIKQFEFAYLDKVKKIFFDTTTRKQFSCDKERNDFFYKYCGIYLEKFSHNYVIFFNDLLAGYILCCDDTLRFIDDLNNPLLYDFDEYYLSYPAHLHINISPEFHSLGLGSKLLKHLELKLDNGVHLLTSVDARNVNFYKKNGYMAIHYNKNNVLMLGKKL